MYVKDIRLKHFRNYSDEHVEFDPKVNIIIGDNAQGKTNLVEALYLLGFGKSFRTSQDKELIQMEDDFTHVSATIQKSNCQMQIDFKYNIRQKKEIKVNEVPLKRLAELIGEFNVVIFSPEDLQLVKGSPNLRRKYMDKSISQIYPHYYHLLIDYNRILKQRNNLLKQYAIKKKQDGMIEIWDEQLAELGAKVMRYRIDFLDYLRKTARKIHFQISHEKEILEIEYQSNYLPKNLEAETLYDKIYSGMLLNLQSKLSVDIKRGFTSVGPHRDDLSFLINGIESKKYGSQGQVRTTALSLKLSEISIIRELLDESPILILDDVLSELDHLRQNQLIKYIAETQSFITTTEVNNILNENLNDARIIHIKNGSITIGV